MRLEDIIQEMLCVNFTIPTQEVFKHYMPKLSHLNRPSRVAISHFIGVNRQRIAKETEQQINEDLFKCIL